VMDLRGRTQRTMIEDTVNTMLEAVARQKPHTVGVSPAKLSPNREDGTGSADSAGELGD
jgi:hypothetical protein